MDSDQLATIITSAAVGALSAAIITFIGQVLDRRARRKELLLSKAIELAMARREMIMRVVEQTSGTTAELWDDAVLSAEYFTVLKHLIEKGDLPAAFKAKVKKSVPDVFD